VAGSKKGGVNLKPPFVVCDNPYPFPVLYQVFGRSDDCCGLARTEKSVDKVEFHAVGILLY
jgi:hypothetical protein